MDKSITYSEEFVNQPKPILKEIKDEQDDDILARIETEYG